jgi:hypothetical protein
MHGARARAKRAAGESGRAQCGVRCRNWARKNDGRRARAPPGNTRTARNHALKSDQYTPRIDRRGARARARRAVGESGRVQCGMRCRNGQKNDGRRAQASPANSRTTRNHALKSGQYIPRADRRGARVRAKRAAEKRGRSANCDAEGARRKDWRRARATTCNAPHREQARTQKRQVYSSLIGEACSLGKSEWKRKCAVLFAMLRNVQRSVQKVRDSVMDSLGLGPPDLFTDWNV